MSAAQPKSAEPSMEEILASIRRIISDDQNAKQPAAQPVAEAPAQPEPVVAVAPPPTPVPAPAPAALAVEAPLPPPEPADEEDVLDLAPKTTTRALQPHLLADDPIPSDVSFQDPADELPAPPPEARLPEPEPELEPLPPPPPPVERLVSAHTDTVVTGAFASLANTVLANNARTLDDLVQDMMRPMIKNWLDDNLPGIVERLVRAEIERVSRGRR